MRHRTKCAKAKEALGRVGQAGKQAPFRKVFKDVFLLIKGPTMDSLLPQLLAFPPHPPPATPLTDAETDKQIRATLHLLSTIPASKLTSGVPGGGDLLEIIDPSINTLPYLYVLLAHITGSGGKQKAGDISDDFAPGTPLWQSMLDFTERFDRVQVRYAGNELRRLVEATATKARKMSMPQAAIAPIRSVILRVDPASATFTITHLTFARICLAARAYDAALPVLDQKIYYLPSATNRGGENNMYPFLCSNHETSSTFTTPESGLTVKLDHRDHMQYYLFGAMIYMGLKVWEKALEFLETVIITPIAVNVSKVQAEAYKKFILVNLLHKGRFSALPATTSAQAAKQLHVLGKVYESLAEIFENSLKNEETNQKLLLEVRQWSESYHVDCNIGLVGQVIQAYRQFSVLQLQNTFGALTIADIARKTSPNPNDYAETGQYVHRLISTGILNATVTEPSENPKSWLIRFCDRTHGPLALSEEQRHGALIERKRRVNGLNDHIRETDRKLSLNKDYIHDAKKKKKEKADGGEEGNPWIQNNPFDHDEDMMAGL